MVQISVDKRCGQNWIPKRSRKPIWDWFLSTLVGGVLPVVDLVWDVGIIRYPSADADASTTELHQVSVDATNPRHVTLAWCRPEA